MHAWEDKVRGDQPAWTVVKPTNLDGSGGQKTYLLPDGSVLCAGYSPSKETSEFVLPVSGTVVAVRLELLTDPSLPRGGPGRYGLLEQPR
jgi:hypothetical protein